MQSQKGEIYINKNVLNLKMNCSYEHHIQMSNEGSRQQVT
jgi:hypothetical protein